MTHEETGSHRCDQPRARRMLTILASIFAFALISVASVSAQTITFETPTYTLGNINGQDGWSKTGPFDVAVAPTSVTGFGTQSLRISNAITSGSFGDQTFSRSLTNEAGETSAQNGGMSGGVRKNRFVAEFNIASAVPGSQQTGLITSVSPDRGDGARMSYLRFEDLADGIHVFFAGFEDVAPFGTSLGDAAGCTTGVDEFTNVDIATLSRTAAHTVRFEIDFVDGPRNDVVRIYIDGELKTTGRSWEDYFRYCEGNDTRTVDSLLFRSAGTAVPANSGNGFFIDNATLASPSTLVVDDNLACPGATYPTIGAAVAAATAGDIINVCAGSYPEMVNVNKSLTIRGAQAGIDARSRPTTAAQESVVSGNAGSTSFSITASDVVVDGFTIQGATNPNLFGAGIYIAAGTSGTELLNNIVQNNLIGSYLVNNSPVNPTIFRRNLFRNNNVAGPASGNAIYTDQFTAGGTVQNVVIDNNVFDGNPNTGINLSSTDATKPHTNITISNNEFKNSNGTGIFALNLTSSSITGNLATTSLGFRLNEGTNGVVVSCNALRNNAGRGIRIGNFATGAPIAANITVNNNDIFGQPTHGIEVPPANYSGTLNAENNWWGSASGPTTGTPAPTVTPGSIAGAVDANPFLTAPASCAANLIVVDPNNLNGWASVSQRTATGGFVGGAGTPPLGVGSYRMTTGAGNSGPDLPQGGAGQGGKTWLTTQAYDGTLLANIAFLSYSTYVSPSSPTSNLTPSLQFQVDLDGNGTRDSAMIFEPIYSTISNGGIQPNIVAGTWQNWNARAGKWWFNNATVFGCGACAYVSFDAVIAAYPNAKIMTWFPLADGYGTQFQAGQNSAGPPWTNFDGNIDNFRIGVNTPGDTYDFEPVIPTVTIEQAATQLDPTVYSPINFTVTFSEDVTGFGDAPGDVLLSGTAGATTAVVTGSGSVYNVAVSGMTTGGTVTASVAAGAAQSAAFANNTASTSVDNTVTYIAGGPSCRNVSTPVLTSLTGVSMSNVAVTTTDLTGHGVIAADFTLNYNPSVITNVVVTAGPVLTGNTVITTNPAGPGALNVSIYVNGAGNFAGAGALVNLSYDVIGPIGSSSPLTLSNFIYNGDLVCSNETNGSHTVISGTVTGNVTYANPIFPNNSPRPVPNVAMNAPGTPNVSGITDVSGNYSLSGFGPGSYTLTPSKPTQVFTSPNGIFSNDASLVSQHVVSLITLNPTQVAAGKVSGLPTLSSFDAALIAQWTVGIPNALNQTGQWKFTPVNVNLGVVNTSAVHNFTALLMGDVSGDWVTGPSARPAQAKMMESKIARASIVDTVGQSGQITKVPVRIDNLKGAGVDSYQFDVTYDPRVLAPAQLAADLAGTLGQGLSVVSHSPMPGLLKVAVYGAIPVKGDGVFVNLQFVPIAKAGARSAVTIGGFRFNDGSVDAVTRSGSVTIVSPVRGRLNLVAK